MKTLSLTVAALAALAVPAAHAAKTAAALVCPVSGTKIASPAKAFNHEVYKGKTYYFCCPECKPVFDKNPGKVLANAAHGKYQKM